MRWQTLAWYGGIALGGYLLYKKLKTWQPKPIDSAEMKGVSVNTGIVPPNMRVAASPADVASATAPVVVQDETETGTVYVPRMWASKGEEFWDVEV